MLNDDETRELHLTVLERRMVLIESLGLFALKVLLTLNAGATVVLLALLGNLQDGAPGLGVDVPALQVAMLWFFAGILCVMAAITSTYVVAQIEVMRWPTGAALPPGWHLALMILPPAISFFAFGVGFVRATFAFSIG